MKRPVKTTVKVSFGENTIRIEFSDGGQFYAYPKELTAASDPSDVPWRSLISDLSTYVIAESWRVQMFYNGAGGEQGKLNHVDGWQYYFNVRHLFQVIVKNAERLAPLRQQWKESGQRGLYRDPVMVFHLRRFAEKITPIPQLNICQMVNHVNAQTDYADDRKRFIKTLLAFRKTVPRDIWPQFIERLSHYLDTATVRGDGDEEFYFDGRRPSKTGRGCGFNGAFIKRANDEHGFSIHT